MCAASSGPIDPTAIAVPILSPILGREVTVQIHAVVVYPSIETVITSFAVRVHIADNVKCRIVRNYFWMFVEVSDQFICQRNRVCFVAPMNPSHDQIFPFAASECVHVDGAPRNRISNRTGELPICQHKRCGRFERRRCVIWVGCECWKEITGRWNLLHRSTGGCAHEHGIGSQCVLLVEVEKPCAEQTQNGQTVKSPDHIHPVVGCLSTTRHINRSRGPSPDASANPTRD